MQKGLHVVTQGTPQWYQHYSKKLKEHVDIMIFIERYPLKRCQGCVKLIASKINCFLNITDLSEVQLCMSSNSWTWVSTYQRWCWSCSFNFFEQCTLVMQKGLLSPKVLPNGTHTIINAPNVPRIGEYPGWQRPPGSKEPFHWATGCNNGLNRKVITSFYYELIFIYFNNQNSYTEYWISLHAFSECCAEKTRGNFQQHEHCTKHCLRVTFTIRCIEQ